MNIETGEIRRLTKEEVEQLNRRGQDFVLIPEEAKALAATMTRNQRRRYKVLIERRGMSPTDAMREVMDTVLA